MLGKNAVYLAKVIGSWRMINMDITKRIETLKENQVIIRSFECAVDELGTMLYEFMDDSRRSNLYGYKMKFMAIEAIASILSSSIDDSDDPWYPVCGKNFDKIAIDLEKLSKILDHEINNNMTTVDSRDKNYKKMKVKTG
jgi:hypothetical protein